MTTNSYSPLDDLPSEIKQIIFTFLSDDTRVLLNCAQVSKEWKRLSEDDAIWKTKCAQIFGIKNSLLHLSDFRMALTDKSSQYGERRERKSKRLNANIISKLIGIEKTPETLEYFDVTPLLTTKPTKKTKTLRNVVISPASWKDEFIHLSRVDVWDQNKKHSALTLSNWNRTVTSTEPQWRSLLGKFQQLEGKRIWNIKIDKCTDRVIGIGLCTNLAD